MVSNKTLLNKAEEKMKLRNLELKDAPLMLEWMHDKVVTENLREKFSDYSIENAEQFIKVSLEKNENIHLAICSDEDEYMGTVSLKNVDWENLHAEFAIVVRSLAMSRGYAWFALEEMLKKAFDEYRLESVYWRVEKNNKRSIRFFDKHNIHEANDIPEIIRRRYQDMNELKWYSVLKGDVLDERDNIVGCKVIRIKTIPTLNAGELSFFESSHDFEFDVKRMYYISKVPEGVRRGFHAHKNLKQLLFCPYGRIQLILENEMGREEMELSDPSIGVIIDKPTWREMLWLQRDSVLCVAASEYYIVEDYIRDYKEFREYINVL